MIAALQVHPDVILLGIVTGMTYGVLGAGLVLIYRSSRIINFAYGEIGAVGAALLGTAVTKWHMPYWIAFIMALAVAGLVGAACEMIVVRRFRAAPIVLTAIVTLGLGTILDSFSAIISSTVGAGITYPQPAGFPQFFVGALLMTPAYTAMLILTPPFVLAVAIFLRRGRLGVAMRAAASNHDAALMAGMRAPRLSSLAWALGGVMAAFTAILVLPTRGFSGGQFLGPGLLLRGLFCGVVAGMTSLPITLIAGLALGVIEQILLLNYPSGGQVDGIILLIIVIALLLQRAKSGRSEDKSVWATVQAFSPLPASYRKVRSIRALPWVVFAARPGGGHPDTRVDERRQRPDLHHHRRLQRGRHVGGHHHRPRRPAVARPVRSGRPGRGGVLAGAIPRRRLPVGHHRRHRRQRRRLHSHRPPRGADQRLDAGRRHPRVLAVRLRMAARADLDVGPWRQPGRSGHRELSVRHRQTVLLDRPVRPGRDLLVRPQHMGRRGREDHQGGTRQRGRRPGLYRAGHLGEAAGIRPRRCPRRPGRSDLRPCPVDGVAECVPRQRQRHHRRGRGDRWSWHPGRAHPGRPVPDRHTRTGCRWTTSRRSSPVPSGSSSSCSSPGASVRGWPRSATSSSIRWPGGPAWTRWPSAWSHPAAGSMPQSDWRSRPGAGCSRIGRARPFWWPRS